jgi:hypothetical protein
VSMLMMYWWGSLEEIGCFKLEIMQAFKMSDLGTLSYYLGIEVK